MAIDRAHIFNKVMFFLKKESAFFTSSEVHMAIGVDAPRQVARDLNFPKTDYSGAVSSGVWQVTMPSNFLKLDSNAKPTFKDSTTIRDLAPKSQTNIGRANILNATPGTPQNYFMKSETVMGLYPPSTSGTIVVPYVKAPTSLSSDTDTNALTENAYMAMAYYVVGECMLKDGDTRTSDYYALYEREVKRLKRQYGELFEEDIDMMPDEDYL